MLSIRWINDPHYFLDQARADYYLMGGEPPGVWWREGAAPELGLRGEVKKWQLPNLFRGFRPKKPGRPPLDGVGPSGEGPFDGRALIQNAGAENHQSAWDLTFSAPKDFGVLWSAADVDTRPILQKIHAAAVNHALGYLQDVAAYTRRGQGGAFIQKAKLLVAQFEHGSSRELDPQLHTHCVVINVCTRPDGTKGTILSRPLYEHKLTAGACYQAALAVLLQQELGLRIRPARVGFEIEGVPRELSRHQSKRRTAIEAALGTKGFSSARASEVATLDTRPGKTAPPRAELFEIWQETNRQFGFTAEHVRQLLGRVKHDITPEMVKDTLANAITAVASQHSHFSEQEVLREALRQSLGQGIPPALLREAVEEACRDGQTLVCVGRRDGYIHYTTAENLQRERQLVAAVEGLSGDARHVVPEIAVKKQLDEKLPLTPGLSDSDRQRNEQQRRAVRQITTRKGAIQVISGVAGAGKTYALKVAHSIWQDAGFRVLGIALAGVAARRLEDETGIKCTTVAGFLKRLEHAVVCPPTAWGPGEILSGFHHSEKDPPTWIDKKTVIVLEEVGMLGTHGLAKITEAVSLAGAKLVALGDRLQLQPLEAGGPMAALEELAGSAELTHITRQRLDPTDVTPDWQRQVVHQFRQGNSVQALTLLAERGRVEVLENRDRAKAALIEDWAKRSVNAPKDHLMIAATNADADDLNARAQGLRAERGLLGHSGVQIGDQRVFTQDRVRFTKPSRPIGVENGDFGTLVAVKPGGKTILVELDRGGRVAVPLKEYADVRLGYASTSHAAQGGTFLRTSVLVGGSMQDLHLTYVQASRHVEGTRFYTDRFEAGQLLQGLACQMAETNAKDLALDVMRENRQPAKGQTSPGVGASIPSLAEVARDTAPQTAPRHEAYFEPTNHPGEARLDLSKLDRLKALLEPETREQSQRPSKKELDRHFELLKSHAEDARGRLTLDPVTNRVRSGPGRL